MSEDDLPEADCVSGATHPRHTENLIGHDLAQVAFLDAFHRGKLHHAWLISGPRGVGKATLAWQIARFLLSRQSGGPDMFGTSDQEDTLKTDREHPVQARISALSDPGLFLLRRPWDADKKRLKAQITVDEVRRLKGFFSMAAGEGAWRVVIVDSIDEMNQNAANALLKMLEEPPAQTILLLVSHQPARLLPTIRSRCRELRLSTLPPEQIAAALNAAGLEDLPEEASLDALAAGSVGEAVAMIAADGFALYAELMDLAASFPRLDRVRMLKLADRLAARDAGEQFDLMIRLIDIFLWRLCRAGLEGLPGDAVPGERETLMRLCPNPQASRAWAKLANDVAARLRHGRAVNLDPAALLLDTMLELNTQAARLAA